MSDKFIRIYQRIDVNFIKPHLMIYGDLGGSCANCQSIDIKFDMKECPQCHTKFQFIAFRNPKVHIPKIHKLFEEKSELTIIDFDDYQRNMGASKAENFFKKDH